MRSGAGPKAIAGLSDTMKPMGAASGWTISIAAAIFIA